MNQFAAIAIVVSLAASTPAGAQSTDAGPLTVTRIDGSKAAGTLVALRVSEIVLGDAAGSVSIARSDLARIEFPNRNRRETADIAWTIDVVGGSRFAGSLLDSTPENLVVKTRWSARTTIAFDRLACVAARNSDAPAAARTLFEASRSRPLPGRDILVTAQDEPKALRGTLLELGSSSSEFEFNDRPRRLATEKVFGVVFAAQTLPAQTPDVTVHLAGGDVIVGVLLDASNTSVRLRMAGIEVEIPLSEVAVLELRSDRVVYLSDLEPASHTSRGLVIANDGHRRDRNVAGGPIVLAGRTYERGIGVRSRSELTYRLDKAFDVFVATVGIDDAVRPNGSADFVVRVDGRDADVTMMTGADEPRDIRIDVAGASKLTLIVDFADNADVGDWANWADARLIVPKKATD